MAHLPPTLTSPRPIRFHHHGAVVEVGDAAPTRTVLDWLREDARCTGTKEGCNEGDCGACTVVIGEVAAPGDPAAVRGLSLKTVNACIQFLPTLDGKALFTVEDLKAIGAGTPQVAGGDKLHPVQQAMVECHGSQCGFCTPGFVMSLWSTYERHQACAASPNPVPTRQQLADELSGNLCRCTGYRPILDAGQRMFDLPAASLDTAPVLAALKQIATEGTFEYAPGPDRFFAPTTLRELAALREAMPQAQLLAGSTDVGLWVNKLFKPLGDILYVGEVAEMKRVEASDAELTIGAAATLEAAWAALAKRWPALTDVWLRFASPPIRNAGTMGGNVANGSPIGDSPPVLMALDAQIELRKGARVRRMALTAFYTDYMKNQLEAGEFVQAVVVPLNAATRQVRAYKISKRFDCDISALCAGLAIELDGKVVKAVRLSYGGMAAIVKRAAAAEAALAGQPWTQGSVNAAKAALAEDFKPLSDMRASAAYRLQVAQNLLQRFWLETRTESPLASNATSVFSVMPHVTT
jgi:xanthine dehydrogenase small subunit